MGINESFIAEWLNGLWDVKARSCKDLNARENALRILAELFEITTNLIRFLLRSVILLFEIIAIAIAVAASSSLIVLSVEIQIKQVCIILCLCH